MKTCPVCKEYFTPSAPMQQTCSLHCAKEQRTKKENTCTKKENKPQAVKRKYKPKVVKLSTLVDKADRVMSVYIRLKHADDHGYVTCISCGRSFRWEETDNGHFISRRHFATRYVEENCHPECKGCNRFNHDHLIGYTQSMIDLYGKSGINELQEESKRLLSPSQKRHIVTEAIEHYTKMLGEINIAIEGLPAGSPVRMEG